MTRTLRTPLLLVFLLLGPALLFHAAPAHASDNIVIIIDGSGSMWGKIQDTLKIVAARDVLRDLIQTLPPDLNLGIVSYGHRRTGDCNDVEVLVELGPDNKELALEAIDTLNPRGKTPLSRAVIAAAEMLRDVNGRRLVLLVSDGEESCGEEPCEAVQTLLDQGLGFVMHVVGLALSEEAQEQLRCMADATGGEYLSTDDVELLREHLIETLSKIR